MTGFMHKHLLGIEELSVQDINTILDLADTYAVHNRVGTEQLTKMQGKNIINIFFENSTRTLTSFEMAGNRLSANTISMAVSTSSIKKGETLIDTAETLNAMLPDVLVMRHGDSGAVKLLSRKVDCAVINAGDGWHEHPTQALLDALTIRKNIGTLQDITVAICGDVAHSRVARSNIILLKKMGAKVHVIAPTTLLPMDVEKLGVEVFNDMEKGIENCDIIMMLRLQMERMQGAFVPSVKEYHALYGLTPEKLKYAKENVFIMHPGPMNRGVEIDSELADNLDKTLIRQQVEMGVAVRMACLDLLTQNKK